MFAASRNACKRATKTPVAGKSAAGPFRKVSSFNGQQEESLESLSEWTEFQSRRHAQKTLVEHFDTLGSTQNRKNTFQPHYTLHRPPKPSQATLSALVAAGAHFGHNASLMNPNFMPYAYGVRAGTTMIDLDQTLPLLRRAANVLRAIAARDGNVVFVGTRPDLRKVVQKAAERMGDQGFHVGERWLPGTLTNKMQVFGLESTRTQAIIPDLVVFLNPLANMPAIRECAIEHVPTMGIVDSNVDPRIVMYPIPANDESTRTAELIAGMLSIAGREGVALREQIELEREGIDASQRQGEKFQVLERNIEML